MPKPLKTREIWGGYARISEDPNDLQHGVLRQKDDITDAILRCGGTPPALDDPLMRVENDTGAFKRQRVTITDHYGETRAAFRVVRPIWADAMRDLRSGAITHLMVYDLDRLARDPYDIEDAIEAVAHFGATIKSATASDLDLSTEMGRMAARLLVMMANKASEDTSRRVKRAHLSFAHQGKPAGGNRPFGFKADKITHDPREAAVIRAGAQELLNGESLTTLARAWEAAGIKTVRGGPWRAQTIRQLYKGPRLAGWRVHQGKVALDPQGSPVRLRNPTTGEVAEPILDQLTFDRIQAIFDKPETRRRVPRRGARHYLLTGLARCGICHAQMYGNAYGEHKGQPRFYYVCQGTTENPHNVTISGHGTDAFIERVTLRYLSREDRVESLPKSFNGQARLDEVGGLLKEIMASASSGAVKWATVQSTINDLELEQDRLLLERDRFVRATAKPTIQKVDQATWDAMDVAKKRALLETVYRAIMIHPAKKLQNRLDTTRIEEIPL